MDYWQYAIDGIISIFTLNNMFYLILGSMLGFAFGILPGLGGHFLMVMMLPFIYGMEPASAILLLMSAHGAVSQGGGVTAILFGTPGEGTNVATLLDGPALTRKGQGGMAVGAIMSGSMIGALFGVMVLATLLPLLQRVVLVFGPPEFLMMGILALTFLAALSTSEGKMSAGILAGLIGLLISFIGLNPFSGEQRFTFNFLPLYDGINMVPVFLGIFALTEMFDIWLKGGTLSPLSSGGKFRQIQMQVFKGILVPFKHIGLILKSGAIGSVIGLLPGLGAGTAQFLAYGQAKQSDKNPEKYGKGEIKGAMAAESSVNATEGGNLASTVAFGIPGSSSMAILISALTIVGVQPGPRFMAGNMDLIVVMMATIVLANLIGAIFGIFAVVPLIRLTYIDSRIIAPIIIPIVFIGAYSLNEHWFDVFLTLIFGILGYVMKKYGYSRAPLVIGFIMGAMIERNLMLSISLYGGEFFLQPYAFIIMLVILFLIFYNIFSNLRKKGKSINHGG